jgi:hypothetical protein
MQSDLNSYLDARREHVTNRAKFRIDELAKYTSQWIAWSADGSRIVASATNPEFLDDLIRAVGEDPEDCLIEGIPAADAVIGSMRTGLEGL